MQRLHLKIYNRPSPPHRTANVQVSALRTFKISLNSACRCKPCCFIVPIPRTWRGPLAWGRGAGFTGRRTSSKWRFRISPKIIDSLRSMSLILQFFPAVLPFHALYSPFSRVQTGPVGFFQIIETLKISRLQTRGSCPVFRGMQSCLGTGRRIKPT